VEAVVVTGPTDNDVTRVLRTGNVNPVTFLAKTPQLSNPLFSAQLEAVTARYFGTDNRFFVVGIGTNKGTCVGAPKAINSNCSPALDSTALDGNAHGASAVSATEAAVATASSAAVKKVAVLGPTGRGAPLRTYTPPNAVGAMAFGDNGKIYAINTNRAEVMILAPNGGISTLALSTAAVTSPEYTAMMPINIYNIPGKDELLVLVRGAPGGLKQLFRIRKPL